MATGKVLQFDAARGYGFVAADDGGEDIFLHASVYDGDSYELVPGMTLEFQVMEGDRGRKAFAVQRVEARAGTVAQPAAAQPAAASSQSQTRADEDEPMCDVLSTTEFSAEMTELLLNMTPALDGQQILNIRQGLVIFARKYGWVDA
jgi:CspA family cold shock protein